MTKYTNEIVDIKEILSELESAFKGEKYLDTNDIEQNWDFHGVYETFDFLSESIERLKTSFVLDHVLNLEKEVSDQFIKKLN